MFKFVCFLLAMTTSNANSRIIGTNCPVDEWSCNWQSMSAGLYPILIGGFVAGLVLFFAKRLLKGQTPSELVNIHHLNHADDDASPLDHLINERGATGGLNKRIDENREIMELIYAKAPELVSQHPWLEGWLKANDAFFIQLANIVPSDSKRHIRDLPVFKH